MKDLWPRTQPRRRFQFPDEPWSRQRFLAKEGDDPPQDPPQDPPPAITDEMVEELAARLREQRGTYKPKEVRRYLDRYGSAEKALEALIEETNDAAERVLKREARLRLEKDEEVKALKGQLASKETELNTAQAELNGIKQAEADKLVDGLLAKTNSRDPKVLKLILQHQEGYEFEVEGAGDKARLMLTKDGKRHNLDTVLNPDWYKQYPSVAPESDTPYPQSGDGGKSLGQRIAEARMGKPAESPSS